jgi:hypothetical protein
MEHDANCGWLNNCLQRNVPKTPHPTMAMLSDDDADDGIVDIIASGVLRTSDDRRLMRGLVENAVADDDNDISHSERIDNIMEQGRMRWYRRRCCCRRNSAAAEVSAVMVGVFLVLAAGG